MAKITFENKEDLKITEVAQINKVTASDINEIKTVVNGLDDLATTNQENISTNETNISDVANNLINKLDKTDFNLPIADENGIDLFNVDLDAGDKLQFEDLDTNNAQKIISAKNKQNKLAGEINKLPKSLDSDNLIPSRLEDTGVAFGIDTERSPSKDITLGSQMDRVIGVEESDANTRGRNLILEAGRTNDYIVTAVFNSLNTGLNFKSLCSDSGGNLYGIRNDGVIVKRDLGTTVFNVINNTQTSFDYLYVDNDDNIYAVRRAGSGTNVGIYLKNTADDDFVRFLQYYNLDRISIASNGDIYVTGANIDKIIRIPNGTTTAIDYETVGGLYREKSIAVSRLNNNIYYTVFNVDSFGLYVQYGGTGDFVQLDGDTGWTDLWYADNGNVFAIKNGQIFVQYQSAGAFVSLEQTITFTGQISSDSDNNIYALSNGEIYFLSSSNKGLPDLDGGALELKAGTGKGTGQSRIEFITGQKLASGTDMQPETVRGYIDENGWFIYQYPIFADNTSAIAGGLPNNAIYKDNNGNLKSVTI